MSNSNIQVTARPTITAVGTREDFETNVRTISTGVTSLCLALAQSVAFAYSTYHKGGEDRHYGIDYIRANVSLSKANAAKLDRALDGISRIPVDEGVAVSKAAIQYANEFTARFFGEVTKASEARKAKAAAKKEDKLKAEKKAIDDQLKAAKAEGRAEAMEEEIEGYEFVLCGEEGNMIPLTPEEYTALAITLSQMRDDVARAKAESKTAVRLAASQEQAA